MKPFENVGFGKSQGIIFFGIACGKGMWATGSLVVEDFKLISSICDVWVLSQP